MTLHYFDNTFITYFSNKWPPKGSQFFFRMVIREEFYVVDLSQL